MLGVVLALTSTACGSEAAPSDSPPQVSTTEHNTADVSFATQMIQHQAESLALVDLTLGRPLDPRLTELADDVRSTQTPEIETMTDWLTSWDEAIPATVRDHAHADHAADGSSDDPDLRALEDAPEAEFADLWLDLMIEHHQQAVTMAAAERDDGQFAAAVDLAATIATTQSEQIDAMRAIRERP